MVPSGTSGAGRVERDRGLDVVLGAQPLDGGLEPEAGLGVVDVTPLHVLAQLDQLAFGVGTGAADLLQLPTGLGRTFGFDPAGGAPAAEELVDPGGELRQPCVDGRVPAPATFQRTLVALDLGPAFRVAGEAVVDLVQPVLEHLATLGELRGAEVELATLRADGRGTFVELQLDQRPRLEQRLRFGGLGLERGQADLQRGDAFDVGGALLVERDLLRSHRLDLDLALAALGLDARQGTLEVVELADRAPFGLGRGSLRLRGARRAR